MSKIFDLSWNENGFWSKFKLVCLSEKRMCRFLQKNNAFQIMINNGKKGWKEARVSYFSSLSSTYHSVSMTAGKKIYMILSLQNEKNVRTIFDVVNSFFRPLSVPFWLFLGGYCYLRSLPASNKMLKIAGGYENLNADQCDVRQSILRRRIFNRKKMLEEALTCIRWGVAKIPPKHCYALLLIGRIDIFERKNLVQNNLDEVTSWLERAVEISEEIQEENPLQAIRIFRHCADFKDRISGNGGLLREKASFLAHRYSPDQLAKI